MEVGVRVRVSVALVDGMELALAVEHASALAGEGGHAEPAESPGQARRFVLMKGRRPPVSSHPHSDKSESKMGVKMSIQTGQKNPQMGW